MNVIEKLSVKLNDVSQNDLSEYTDDSDDDEIFQDCKFFSNLRKFRMSNLLIA